jgi:hypothetical protein
LESKKNITQEETKMKVENKITENFSKDIQKHNDFNNAMTLLMPIWDSISDVRRVAEMVRLIAYLTSPQYLKKDHEDEVFFEFLMEVNERLTAIYETLEAARQNVLW